MKIKKIIITFIIAFLVIGLGIYFAIKIDNNDYDFESFVKAQLVEVYDFETDGILYKYDTKEEIDDFVVNLGIENWKISSIPQDDIVKYYVVMYQEPTKNVIDDENNSGIEQIATMIIYSSGEYVELKTSGMKFDFKSSQNLLSMFN